MAAEHFGPRRGRHRLSDLVRLLLRCLTRSLEGKSRDAYQRTIMDICDLVDSAFPGSKNVLQFIERGLADVSFRRDHDSTVSVEGIHSVAYIDDEIASGIYDEIAWCDLFISWSPSRNEGLRT